jgi:hypothetical protein
MQYLLTLTACIRTKVDTAQFINDHQQRLKDYEVALRFWLDYPDPRTNRILFIENSGASLDSLRQIASTSHKTVEFVSLNNDSERPEGLHYGYSEMMMLDHGLRQSKLRATTTHMIKATGRLRFPRLTRLLDRLPDQYDIAVDSRYSKGLTRSGQRFTTTQIFMVSHDFYDRYLRYEYLALVPNSYPTLFEHVMFERLIPMRDQPGVIMRWPVNLDPIGKAAHWGRDYDSFSRRIVAMGRGIARVIAPNWWV